MMKIILILMICVRRPHYHTIEMRSFMLYFDMIMYDIIESIGVSPSERTFPSTKFVAQLSSLVVSGVRYLFVSDIRYSAIEYSERVIVPLIVLRNHERFDPLSTVGGEETLAHGAAGPTNDMRLDIRVIREEIESLLLPHQQLVLVPSLHSLHDHHHISTAVWKSLKGDTIHTATKQGVYRPQTVPYIDTQILADAMHHAADLFTVGLIQRHHTQASATPIGHRVLPVYIFSLLGLPPNVLFDRTSLHASSPDHVMVLQTASPSIEVPFFDDDGQLLSIVVAVVVNLTSLIII
jgi:hypothetical protein